MKSALPARAVEINFKFYFKILQILIALLPISLESGKGICDMVEKSVSLDILSCSINKFSFVAHSSVSNSLFCY